MSKDSSEMKQAMFIASDAVIGAGVLIIAGVWIGMWVDGKLHSAPLCLIAGALIGLGLGIFRMVRKAMSLEKSADGSGAQMPSRVDFNAPAPPGAIEEKDINERDPLEPPTDQQPNRKPRDMTARSAFEFLDQGDSKQ